VRNGAEVKDKKGALNEREERERDTGEKWKGGSGIVTLKLGPIIAPDGGSKSLRTNL